MRTRWMSMVGPLLLVAAGAWAQESAATGQQDVAKTPSKAIPDIGFVNQIDFGYRGTAYTEGSDQARYQRYQDMRDGGVLDRFRFNKESSIYTFSLQADHVGYRDQRYSAAYNKYGKLRTSFEWNQMPIYYSGQTQTLYTSSSPGILLLPDPIQAGLQNKIITLPQAVTGATTFDTRSRRDVANFLLQYNATPAVDVNIYARNTHKEGTQPWAGSFGISGAVATEFAVPIDHRTTELGSNLEWSNGRGFARVAYDGSFFQNNVTSLVWDNPSRVTDAATGGPVSGRMNLWPNTNQNAISATGAIKMPGRSKATAFVSLTDMSNNEVLQPFTINSALVSPTLDRPTADVKAIVTAMNFTFNSRPVETVWFNVRYRQYKFDNQTIPFEVTQGINYDTSPVTLNIETEPFGYTRHTFDADATYSPIAHLGFRGGYTREEVDRTYRIVEKTTEDIGRVSVDLTGTAWMTIRGVYEHGKRVASPVDETELLAIGEQPTLRQYDIADRNRDRFSAILTITPVSILSLSATAAVGKDDYPGTTYGLRTTTSADIYGLRSADNNMYSFGFDVVPMKPVSFGASYTYEKNRATQTSRTANPLPANTVDYLNDPTQQFNDPRRDWSDNSRDTSKYANASVDLIKLIPRTDVRAAYDYTRNESFYVYGLTPDTVIVAPAQLTPVLTEQHRATTDVKFFVTSHFAFGGVYWFDKYNVNDFALNPLGSLAQPPTASSALMMMGYYYKPYTANTVMARLTYLW